MDITTTAEADDCPYPLSVKETTKGFDISQSEIYRRLNAGDILAKKLRSRTLIVAESVRRYIESLPNK
jgi:hypothetical protein